MERESENERERGRDREGVIKIGVKGRERVGEIEREG